MWEMSTVDFEASCSISRKGQEPEPYLGGAPTKLIGFIHHLEDSDVVNFRIECRNLKEATSEV